MPDDVKSNPDAGERWVRFLYDRWYEAVLDVLDLEESGAYFMLMLVLYREGGAIKDNDQRVAAFMSTDVRRWKRIKKRLLSLGKIYI